jgi:hypothetical protein
VEAPRSAGGKEVNTTCTSSPGGEGGKGKALGAGVGLASVRLGSPARGGTVGGFLGATGSGALTGQSLPVA